jgi:hypothetical protein
MNQTDEYPDDPLMSLPPSPPRRRPRLPRGERLLLERALADPQAFDRMMRRMWRAKPARRNTARTLSGPPRACE